MIQVIQANQRQINFYLHQFQQQSQRAFVLHSQKNFPSGFYGMRLLVSFLKKTLGEDFIHEKLVADRAIASFIFPELAKAMNENENREYQFYCARLESRLNVAYGLFERLAGLLSSLVGEFEMDLLIPDVRTIDPESLRVIENYYRFTPTTNIHLYLGFTTDVVDDEDADGITWQRYQGDVQFFAGGFLQYPDVQHVKLGTGELETVDWGVVEEPTAEEEVFQKISLVTSISPELVDEVFHQLNASYERFSFRAVMKIGLLFLENQYFTDLVLRAQVHGWIGSAASFYQFTHHANPPFDDFLVYHFEQALKYENRPEIRLALYYRISFTFAERRSDLDSASFWTEAFVEETMNSSLPAIQKNYHLAWAYNVRGHVYAHTGRFTNAAEDAEKAYDLLYAGIRQMEANEETLFNVWLNDYKLSVFNLTIHQVYTGDEENEYEYSRLWHKRMDDIMTFMPRIMLFDTFHWVDYHRNKRDIVHALQSAEEGIADAKQLRHGQIYIYTLCAADFNYRLGNIEKALQYFRQADRLRPIYNDLFYFLSIPWFEGICLAKLKRYDEAEAVFVEELKRTAQTDYRIHLVAQLAQLAAEQTKREEFEALINTAIDEAVEYGELNVLIKVALSSCWSLLALNDTSNAHEALDKVIELRETAIDTQEELSKTVLLESYCCELLLKGYSEQRVEAALLVLEDALNDIESWQYVSKISAFVHQFELQANPSNRILSALQQFHFVVQQQTTHQLAEKTS